MGCMQHVSKQRNNACSEKERQRVLLSHPPPGIRVCTNCILLTLHPPLQPLPLSFGQPPSTISSVSYTGRQPADAGGNRISSPRSLPSTVLRCAQNAVHPTKRCKLDSQRFIHQKYKHRTVMLTTVKMVNSRPLSSCLS